MTFSLYLLPVEFATLYIYESVFGSIQPLSWRFPQFAPGTALTTVGIGAWQKWMARSAH